MKQSGKLSDARHATFMRMGGLAEIFNGGQPLGNRTAGPNAHDYKRGLAYKKAKRMQRKSAQRRNRK